MNHDLTSGNESLYCSKVNEAKAKGFSEIIRKFNHYHGKSGLFANSGVASGPMIAPHEKGGGNGSVNAASNGEYIRAINNRKIAKTYPGSIGEERTKHEYDSTVAIIQN